MTPLLTVLSILATYFLSSAIFFLVVVKSFRVRDDALKPVFLCVFGLGPVVISWLLALLLTVFPSHERGFYITVVGLFFSMLLLFGFKEVSRLGAVFRGPWGDTAPEAGNARIPVNAFLAFSALLCTGMFVYALAMPVTGNDPLEYAAIARLLYQQKNTANYPFLTADPQSGFYSITSHPLGYIMLITWGHLLQGGTESSALTKVVSPMFTLYTLILVRMFASRVGRLESAIAVLLLITTPSYFLQSSYCHIDSMRIFTFFLVFVTLFYFLKYQDFTFLVLSGVAIGANLFSHSISILTPFFVFVVYVMFSKERMPVRAKHLLIMMGIAVLLSGWRYLENFALFNSFVNNDVQAYQLEKIDFVSYLRNSRQIYFASDRILLGVFKAWCVPQLCGLSFWAFFISLLLCWKQIRSRLELSIGAVVAAVFFALVVISVLLNKDIFIQNERYWMTILPFTAVAGSLCIGRFIRYLEATRATAIRLTTRVMFLGLAGLLTAVPMGWLARNAYSTKLQVSAFGATDAKKYMTSIRPVAEIISLLNSIRSDTTKVLVFQFSEFAFYSSIPFVQHMDPRLLAAVKASTPDQAFAELRRLGVTHIFVPDYLDPVFTNSEIFRIAADPARVQLVRFFDGFALYQLREDDTISVTDLGMDAVQFEAQAVFSNAFLHKISSEYDFRCFSPEPIPVRREADKRTHTIDIGASKPRRVRLISTPIELEPHDAKRARQFIAAMDIAGSGWLEVYVVEHGSDGGVRRSALWSSAIRTNNDRKVQRLFDIDSQTSNVKFELIWYGTGTLNIGNPVLRRIRPFQ